MSGRDGFGRGFTLMAALTLSACQGDENTTKSSSKSASKADLVAANPKVPPRMLVGQELKDTLVGAKFDFDGGPTTTSEFRKNGVFQFTSRGESILKSSYYYKINYQNICLYEFEKLVPFSIVEEKDVLKKYKIRKKFKCGKVFDFSKNEYALVTDEGSYGGKRSMISDQSM